jgi:putative endonuclease
MGADQGGARRRRVANALGREGEELAARWLERRGYRVVGRDFHGRRGQLDLICRRGPAVVLVEVKTRTSSRWGAPAEAVTPAKRRALESAAREYRALAEWRGPIHFAVVSVLHTASPPQLELIEHPF